MQGFKVIPLCQVGPNGEDRLITDPPGDEWVGQAVTPVAVDGQTIRRRA